MKSRNVWFALHIMAAVVCGSVLGMQDVLAGLRHWQAPDDLIAKAKLEIPQPILQVELVYDAEKDPSLSIKRASLTYGYAPQYERVESGYVLSLLTDRGDEVYALTFAIPQDVDPSPLAFSLTVPVVTGAAKLQLKDPQHVVISAAN